MSQKIYEMKPYKKRSFFNHVQTNSNVMEVEIGEEQATPSPPSEDGEKEKNKYGEPKSRKKWKRKISRKQFRHHDIKLFTPGEFRSSTFLKQKDSPSGLPTKAALAESITESIVTSLGGQKNSPSNKTRIEDVEGVTRKNDIEENNNSNTLQNNNSVGKHNLPAIILEIPSARRRSVDSANGAKAPIFKYPEKFSNDQLLIRNTIEEIREQVHQIEKLKQTRQENGFQKEDERKNAAKLIAQPVPMETNEVYEEPQNLSLKSNYSAEVPVDLSKKTSPPPYSIPNRKLMSVSHHYQQGYHEDVIRSFNFVSPEYPFDISLYENLKRLNKLLFAWKEILQRFINQGFSLDYLDIAAQAYLGIENEVKGGLLSRDETIKCQQLLAEAYRSLQKELALLNPDLDPTNVLRVYAHPDNKDKKKLHDYLKDLWLKSVYRPPIQGPLTNYRDLTNSPPTPCFPEEQSTPPVLQQHNTKFLAEQVPKNQFLSQSMQSNLGKIGTVLGRPRSKSHRVPEPRNGQFPLRRSISNPTNEKYHKTYSYLDKPMGCPTMPDVGKKSSAHHHSTIVASSPIRPMNIDHSAPLHHLDYPFTASKFPMPNIHRLTITEASRTSEKVPDTYQPTNLLQFSPVEDKISSTTDFLQVEKLSSNSMRHFYQKMPATTPKLKEHQPKIPPRVIVVDNSMQITKEIQAERRKSHTSIDESDSSSPARISSLEKMSSSEENLRQAFANDQEENTEFLDWLERLNKDEKLKNRFLSKMGINDRKDVTRCDTIEIVDSDDEEAIKIKPLSETHPKTLKISGSLTSKPKSTPPISPKDPEPFHAPKTPSTKTLYSPQIEPISPVGNEPTFTFPKVPRRTKMETVTSPSYLQKRKTPPIFPGEKVPLTTLNGSTKRRKSLERPNTSNSPRLAPSGKLCYVRDSCMFLRYYDDTQVELFIKNLSTPDEELLRTTGIDPQKLQTTYKPPGNFALDQLGRTEIIHLPRDVEFSRKEELPEVEEFVQESKLVEKHVPQDFAKFYRYVTGFQIIKNKHPVSLQTFLTMYNTNRTTELLRKYLERIDEDSFAA